MSATSSSSGSASPESPPHESPATESAPAVTATAEQAPVPDASADLKAGRRIATRGLFAIAVVYIVAALLLLFAGWETLKPLFDAGEGNARIYLLLGMEILLLLAGNWFLVRSGIWVKELAAGVAGLAMLVLLVFQLWGYLLGSLEQLDFPAFALYEGTLIVALGLTGFLVRRMPVLGGVALVFPVLALIVLMQTYTTVFAEAGSCVQTPVVLGQLMLALTALLGFAEIARRSPVLQGARGSLFKTELEKVAKPSLFKPDSP